MKKIDCLGCRAYRHDLAFAAAMERPAHSYAYLDLGEGKRLVQIIHVTTDTTTFDETLVSLPHELGKGGA